MTNTNSPPRIPEQVLRRLLPRDAAGSSILGDLREEYAQRAATAVTNARRWYWREAFSIATRRVLDRVLKPLRPATTQRSSRKGDAMLARLIIDFRYAFRTLRRSMGFTIAAATTLAIGVGANTAIFSVVNGILLEPLPFPDADRLTSVWHAAPGLGYDRIGMSPGIFTEYRDQVSAFENIGLYVASQSNLTGDGEPERVRTVTASRSLFDVLGVNPTYGRLFAAAEEVPNAPNVALISERLWERRFGSDPSVVGKTIQVSGNARQVVGIVPTIAFPSEEIDLWLPLTFDPAQPSPGNFGFSAIGRLQPGVRAEEAKLQLDQVLNRTRETYADSPSFVAFLDAGRLSTIVNPMKEDIVGNLRDPLLILLGTVGFVLLIACANVANLFLVRAEGRQREMAVRNALGASRGTLIRQHLMESTVLAGIGSGAAVLLAWIGVPLLMRMAPPELPRIDNVRVDLLALGFTVATGGVAALLFGLVPAIRNSSPKLLPTLRSAGRGASTGPERHLFRSSLVVVQTALALILLVGSGLLVKSFREIRNVDPGFDAENVVTFGVTLPQSRYSTPSQNAAFHDQLLERLRGLPGVLSAGGVVNVPFAGQVGGTAHEVEDQPTAAGELPPILWYTFASPEYFETMRIGLLSGRTFERRDHQQTPGNAIVSEALAERFWPGQDALGKRIRFAGDSTGWETVIGVVASVRDLGLREEPTEMLYYPMISRARDEMRPNGTTPLGWSVNTLGYVVRANNAEALMGSIRATVWEIDPDLPITAIGTVDRLLANSILQLSFTMIALVVAAVMAMILGSIGLYGVLAYIVSQRRREIGVRVALGAQQGAVRAMVVKQGMQLAVTGLAIGLVGAFGLTRFLQDLLFGTTAVDPFAYVMTSLVLLSVVVVASYIPARRASSVDPVEALRME